MPRLIGGVLLIIIIFVIFMYFAPSGNNYNLATSITSFEDCARAGNPVMESYPRQCRAGGQSFTEYIGNELDKNDLIRIENPRPNSQIATPLEVVGTARGKWFFEATFPVVLYDEAGKVMAEGIADAIDDWMTEDFVPFKVVLHFSEVTSDRGKLILYKSNPSGLPENEDYLEIPIYFK